eukprot:TRINITY_DN17120_c0_g1_i1.p3 TRINITY_DN17120_c0_g1~~TRINITY_DN17120_c0_g1_i1.p3  ORF type:complete len:66 (-),score=1.60 TRINITY_DN17120_c0_g1_i1:141-338(-)
MAEGSKTPRIRVAQFMNDPETYTIHTYGSTDLYFPLSDTLPLHHVCINTQSNGCTVIAGSLCSEW